MKILQISKYYYPFIGGIEQVARDCSNALSEHEVKVLCFNHEKGNQIDVVDGVEIIRAGCFAKVASQSLSLSYSRILNDTIKNFQPDAIIFHYPNPFVAHLLLKVLKKYPKIKLLVYWHLDIYKQKLLKRLFHRQNIKICRRADKVLGATPVHLEESAYYPFFKDKCCVLPYGIDLNKLTVSNDIVKQVDLIRSQNIGKTICFAIGRLVPYKGMGFLIKASELLDDSFIIYIAGSGPLENELKELSKNNHKVKLLGKISDQEAMVYRSACDIFCFPSITRNECFGLALAESMYLGKPAITFTIPHSGVNYVSINGETGIEVENKNIEEYANAIKVLSKDSELRLKFGQAAHQRVLDNFTFEKFKNNLNTILGE